MKLNAEALRVIRERSGLSKSELADRAGIDRSLVTRLENGERPGTPSVILKLATALQCSQVAICTLDLDPTAPTTEVA
jgi:transcriptional regulator with XRE-family HTH domain